MVDRGLILRAEMNGTFADVLGHRFTVPYQGGRHVLNRCPKFSPEIDQAEYKMKPGKHDKRYKMRFEGHELAVLHKLADLICEAFGLDRKIDAYKGVRPITLYRWDLDCLESVTNQALRDPAAEEITTEPELLALRRLNERFRELLQTKDDDD